MLDAIRRPMGDENLTEAAAPGDSDLTTMAKHRGKPGKKIRAVFTTDDVGALEKIKELAVKLGVARAPARYKARFTVRVSEEMLAEIMAEAKKRKVTPVEVGREWMERGRPK